MAKNSNPKMPPLFTIGYELAKPAALFRELKKAKVDLLVDTRAVPASRKPGFSKKSLAASLEDAGIGYLHLQKLGTPKEGRDAAHAGDYDTAWRIYDKHIKTRGAQAELDELIFLTREGKRVCLLCYERDPNECHRSRIAALVHKRTRARVENLIPVVDNWQRR